MFAGAQRDTLITSNRLVLNPVLKQDYAEWAALRTASEEHLRPWEPMWPHDAHSKNDWARRLKAWTAGWKHRRNFVFLIRRISDDTMLGGVSLTNVRTWPVETATVGYWLGASYQGHGYMCEAVAALCDWAFNDLALKRLDAGIVPENSRSRAVLEKVGFSEEGFAKGYLEIAGERRDHILFGLVRADARR